jgi:lipid II:glycine glycyltransferase (peptidoglycan interpeptide bridge formation enzyme)
MDLPSWVVSFMIGLMNAEKWNRIVASFPEPHLLQSWQWGAAKAYTGWEPVYKVWGGEEQPDAAAMILQKRIPIPGIGARLRILYVPKGPLVRDWGDEALVDRVLGDLADSACQKGGIFIKIDPDVPLGVGMTGEDGAEDDPVGAGVEKTLVRRGWQFSRNQIQFRNTVLVDLRPAPEAMLMRMKQKTRYNIRLAGRKGVAVRTGRPEDVELLYEMYAETARRDGFVIREAGYYRALWLSFMGQHTEVPEAWEAVCEPLVAEVDGEAVAAVVIFRFAGKAIYMHGMSRATHRNLMPNYLLQWEAMVRARDAGCSVYDLWGAPEVFDESDSMWGVFRFKQGLGGEVRRTLGAYDLAVKPVWFRLYTRVLPRVLGWMRRRAAEG